MCRLVTNKCKNFIIVKTFNTVKNTLKEETILAYSKEVLVQDVSPTGGETILHKNGAGATNKNKRDREQTHSLLIGGYVPPIS